MDELNGVERNARSAHSWYMRCPRYHSHTVQAWKGKTHPNEAGALLHVDADGGVNSSVTGVPTPRVLLDGSEGST